ncbi:MAG: hypothetical protein AAF631_05255 [Pseudomonadota bacterium]
MNNIIGYVPCVKDVIEDANDLVRLTLTLPREEVENETVERLRQDRIGFLERNVFHGDILDYEPELRLIGLLSFLINRYGYKYGSDIIDDLYHSYEQWDLCEDEIEVRLIPLVDAIQRHFGRIVAVKGKAA